MKIEALMNLSRNELNAGKLGKQQEKEDTAVEFEKLFARYLVKNLTKDSFKMADDSNAIGSSNQMYREFITDTLATELAQQRTLGMADLVTRYWDQIAETEKNKIK